MLVLPGTLTIKVKYINSNWSNTGLTGSPPTDSETHIALVYRAVTASSSQISYEGKKTILVFVSLARSDNERREMHVA
jgi:hypothetical protein